MQFIKQKKFSKPNTAKYTLKYDINYSEWMRYFLQVDRPNIIQSWSYGVAKARNGNWQINRGLIYEYETPIAMVQIFYKSFFGFKFIRINRGPLWLIKNPSTTQIIGVLSCIKKYWKFPSRVLFIAPNLEVSFQDNARLSKSFLFKRKGPGWRSCLVNLEQTDSQLYSELRDDWRKRLKASLKNNLKFIVSKEEKDFISLLESYKLLQKSKGFFKPTISFLESIYKYSQEFDESWVALVLNENELLGGYFVVRYGSTCVSVISWLSDEGRSLKAGHFLLWNIILDAKEKGCKFFDHGGIAQHEEGATKFKRGIPNTVYELIGEYIS